MRQKTSDGFLRCRICGESKMRIRETKRRGLGWHFCDESGNRWHGKVCNSCQNVRIMMAARRNGARPIDEVTANNVRKGRKSEHVAAEYFRAQGYDVEMTTYTGPDLTLKRKGTSPRTVEVKSATRVGRFDSWSVGAVLPKRKRDNLIAIVIDNKYVYVEPMKRHLMACTKGGGRNVTSLVKLVREQISIQQNNTKKEISNG